MLHFRLCDVLDFPSPVAIGLDSHDDRLGASRRHGAGSSVRCVVQFQAHRDDLGFHLADGGEDVRV